MPKGPSDKQVNQITEQQAQRLIQLYTDAEREILAELNRALLKGNQTDLLKGMLQNVQVILKDLQAGSLSWCEDAIPALYLDGAKYADGQLTSKASIGFGAIHQQAMQVLADNVFQRLDHIGTVIGRQVQDIYRQMQLDVIKGSVAGFDSVQKTAKKYRENLASVGVTGLKDKAGRNWNMKTYASMVARTATMEAHLQGTATRLLELGQDLVEVSSHINACEYCQPWQGKVLSLTGKTPGYPTLDEAKEQGLFHPNCFPAGVLVRAPRPLATMTRWYDGKIIIIKTASGIELPVTPNHPILTTRGWVAAGLLNVGDKVIKHTGQEWVMRSVDPNDIQIPTRIEDVINSFGQSSGMSPVTVPVSAEDFHGDGRGSQVCVVRPNGLLRDGINSILGQPSGECFFCKAAELALNFPSLGAAAQIIQTFFSATDGGMCGGCLLKSLLTTQPGHSIAGSFGPVGSNGDPSQRKALPDESLRTPNFFSNLLFGLPGQVTIEQIVEVDKNWFSGHVYNLQTRLGWYVCNSIITHNCGHAYSIAASWEDLLA